MHHYTLFERIPAFLYPGGVDSYLIRLNECVRAYGYSGAQYACTDLIALHGALHFFGAVLLVLGIHALSRKSLRASVVASVSIATYFFWQEFIDQPIRLHQIMFKSLLDFGTWVVPLVFYWVLSRKNFRPRRKRAKKT